MFIKFLCRLEDFNIELLGVFAKLLRLWVQ